MLDYGVHAVPLDIVSIDGVGEDVVVSRAYMARIVTLPESGDLPSAKRFAECIPSGIRQKSYLPSASETTLDKIMALGIPISLPSAEKRPLDKLGKNTR